MNGDKRDHLLQMLFQSSEQLCWPFVCLGRWWLIPNGLSRRERWKTLLEAYLCSPSPRKLFLTTILQCSLCQCCCCSLGENDRVKSKFNNNTFDHPSRNLIPNFFLVDMLWLKALFSLDEGAYLISVIRISQTLGMIKFGWVGDQKWCNVTKTFAVSLIRESTRVNRDKFLW